MLGLVLPLKFSCVLITGFRELNMASDNEVVAISNSLETAVKERDRVQLLVTQVGTKQTALTQQLVQLNQRVSQLRVDLRQALQGA